MHHPIEFWHLLDYCLTRADEVFDGCLAYLPSLATKCPPAFRDVPAARALWYDKWSTKPAAVEAAAQQAQILAWFRERGVDLG
jgi:hypothetical protein